MTQHFILQIQIQSTRMHYKLAHGLTFADGSQKLSKNLHWKIKQLLKCMDSETVKLPQ